MTVIRQFRKGQSIAASHLNSIVGRVNDLSKERLPSQVDEGTGAPLIDDDEETESESAGAVDWVEVSRTTSTVRVTNPEDSEQYVDVERAETVLFRLPDGTFVRLNMTN